MLCVTKKEGSLRLCIDYWKLNQGTIKDRYPLPLIAETFAQLPRAKYISRIDICNTSSLIRVQEEDAWKTAICTCDGLFEFQVMPFGLTNALATFQRYVNKTLHLYLNVFCTAYLDDDLIYSQTLEEHIQHVCQILDLL
jgi:hypothetical protein